MYCPSGAELAAVADSGIKMCDFEINRCVAGPNGHTNVACERSQLALGADSAVAST